MYSNNNYKSWHEMVKNLLWLWETIVSLLVDLVGMVVLLVLVLGIVAFVVAVVVDVETTMF